MHMEIQPAFKASSILKGLGSDPVLTDVIPSSSQLFESFEPLQIRVPTPTVSKTCPESAYQWLVEVLDGLIDLGNRHGHYGVINLMENEYQWLDEVLEELIYSVGENDNHLLSPLMEFVIRLISNYEDAYVPKLTEQFTKLAENGTIEDENDNWSPATNSIELNDDELAAHAFFSIGYLLYQGNQSEKALSAYNKAIALKPDYAEVYNNRGISRSMLRQHDKALADYTEAIRLKPDYAMAYYNRAFEKMRQGDLDSANLDYTEAICLKSDYAEAYAYRGIVKVHLAHIGDPKSDFQTALELAEKQGQGDLKTFIEKQLHELNNSTTQDCEN